MPDGDPPPAPPDPPSTENTTAWTPQTKTRGSSRPSRPSTNTPSSNPPPPTSQSLDRPTVSGLAEFEAGKARKRQATAGPEDRPGRPDSIYLVTPRSVRFKNLFSSAASTPTLLEVTQKLYNLIENSIKLPKKGAEKISLGSETAADVKTLAARLLELAEADNDVPTLRRNPFLADDEEGQVERALAGANRFGCQLPNVIESQLKQISKDIAELKHAASLPTRDFQFSASTATAKTPSYALAASKHANRHSTNTPAPTTFRPTLNRTAPPPPPTSLKSNNTVTLTQNEKKGSALSNINYPTLIALINSKLTEAVVKEKPADHKPIQIRSVHRHPSNDVLVYTTTPQQAKALRQQGDKWVHLLSYQLSLQHPVHTVVVHGIPASFQPSDPQHLEMLTAMNPETLTPAPAFIKWISLNAIQRGASHSSIRIGFIDANQAKKAVEQKIFFGRYNKRTEFGRKTRPRCMNCLQDGHTSNHCKEPMMCPYCAGPHAADRCVHKGKMTSNCTACAWSIKASDQTTDLEVLFSTTPVHLHHSPLDPTCPTVVAKKRAEAAKALALATASQPPPAQGSVTITPDSELTNPSVRPPTDAPATTGENDAMMVISS